MKRNCRVYRWCARPSHYFKFAAGTAIVALISLVGVAVPVAGASTFTRPVSGDLIASLANGQVNEYTPTGTFVQTLVSNAQTPTGSAFDGQGNLYIAEFANNDILKVDASTGAVSVFSNNSILGDGTTYNSPESIAFGPGYKEMYISDANRDGVNGGIHVVNAVTGKGIAFYPLPSSIGSMGVGESDWLALSHSGTLIMTNENPVQGVMTVNPSTGDINTPSFIPNLPNVGYALSFDSSGNLWVSDTNRILEYSPSGRLIRTITNPAFETVFASVFNPTFKTIYAGDLSTGKVFTYDLNGNLTNTFQLPSGIDGLSVAGTVLVPPSPGYVPPSTGYVAMGDSYSSGEGNGNYNGAYGDTNTPTNHCHRSPTAYGPELASVGSFSQFKFVACSGAVTNDLFYSNPKNAGEPPQLNALSRTTGLVTLTIGGNDIGFPQVLEACVYADIPVVSPPPTPCSQNQSITSMVDTDLAALASLSTNCPISGSYYSEATHTPIHSWLCILLAIHARAPNAEIDLVGYPQLFSGFTTPQCNVGRVAVWSGPPLPDVLAYPGTFIPAGSFLGMQNTYVGQLDAKWMNHIGIIIAADELAAVDAAQKMNVSATFTDVNASFAYHRFCDSQASYFHRLSGFHTSLKATFLGSGGLPIPGSPIAIKVKGYTQPFSGSFHPNAQGVRAYVLSIEGLGGITF